MLGLGRSMGDILALSGRICLNLIPDDFRQLLLLLLIRGCGRIELRKERVLWVVTRLRCDRGSLRCDLTLALPDRARAPTLIIGAALLVCIDAAVLAPRLHCGRLDLDLDPPLKSTAIFPLEQLVLGSQGWTAGTGDDPGPAIDLWLPLNGSRG